MERNLVRVFKLWDGATIAKNAAITSSPVDIRQMGVLGYFALHLITTGTGTTTVTYIVAPEKGETFLAPATAVDILTAAAVGSYHTSFNPLVTPFLKIVITEDNVNPITSVRCWLVIG